ncbi:uncharacterized protein LOC128952883 [Oppia nitens]|uniref:uncharacterized protein LOC128952883 n=1 Tax=Oppia nitens TaxID=1686743 RepID=UPI0023DB00FA|nr:uncharacterized protein LOC128952883 [Oppia nitens]
MNLLIIVSIICIILCQSHNCDTTTKLTQKPKKSVNQLTTNSESNSNKSKANTDNETQSGSVPDFQYKASERKKPWISLIVLYIIDFGLILAAIVAKKVIANYYPSKTKKENIEQRRYVQMPKKREPSITLMLNNESVRTDSSSESIDVEVMDNKKQKVDKKTTKQKPNDKTAHKPSNTKKK